MSAPVIVSHRRSSRDEWDLCFGDGCLVDEDGWTTCGERACPACGSPAVTVTKLVGGLERGTCECGEVFDA